MQSLASTRAFTAARPAAASRRQLVCVAAKPTKAADFRSLSNEEICSKIQDLKKELASVRFLARTRGISEFKPGEQLPQPNPDKVPKPHLFKHLRLQVAQMETIIRERQLADGIDRRAALTLQRRVVAATK